MKASVLLSSLFWLILFQPSLPVEKLRELAWSGVPHYMRPDVWRLLLVLPSTTSPLTILKLLNFWHFLISLRTFSFFYLRCNILFLFFLDNSFKLLYPIIIISFLNMWLAYFSHLSDPLCYPTSIMWQQILVNFYYLNLNINWQQGYAPPNSDRREAVLRRKRLEYLESVGQFYDLPDSERSDDEINMLRQVFFFLVSVLLWQNFQKSLSNCILSRSLLTVQGLYQTSVSFSKHRCRNLWSVFYIHGELYSSGSN